MDKNVNSTKKILILGGNGFIGSNLAEFLAKFGDEIIIFDRYNTNYANLKAISDKIKIIKGNFLDPLCIEEIFDKNKIDIVIHLICNINPGTSLDLSLLNMNLNLNATIKLLEIMRKKSVNNIIFFSSGGAIYGLNNKNINCEDDSKNPINFYGWLKLSIENYIQMCQRLYGLNYIILRPSNAYGKNQDIQGNQGLIAIIMGKLIHNKDIEIWGDGSIIRDYIHIEDICKGVYSLIKKNNWNDIYNIGSGKGLSVNEILIYIKKITGIDFPVKYTENREVDAPINILDTTKLKNKIAWGNLVDIEQGIKIMWEYCKSKIDI